MRTEAISSSEFVKPGMVLVREGTKFPGPVEPKRRACRPRWNVVEGTAAEIDREITKAGWHFFWMAASIEGAAFAFDPGKAVSKALDRLLSAVGPFNAVEVGGVQHRNFLCLHYATVRAHARHIQRSPILFEASRPERAANAGQADKSMTVGA